MFFIADLFYDWWPKGGKKVVWEKSLANVRTKIHLRELSFRFGKSTERRGFFYGYKSFFFRGIIFLKDINKSLDISRFSLLGCIFFCSFFLGSSLFRGMYTRVLKGSWYKWYKGKGSPILELAVKRKIKSIALLIILKGVSFFFLKSLVTADFSIEWYLTVSLTI